LVLAKRRGLLHSSPFQSIANKKDNNFDETDVAEITIVEANAYPLFLCFQQYFSRIYK